MEIIIPLPGSISTNTYAELNSYLKQLELAVHYAQKSVENAEKTGVTITEDCFVTFEHSALTEEMRDNYYEELQTVGLRININ